MLSLLTGLGAPIPLEQKTLNLIETPPAIVKVVEPTLAQKIESNYYKCNTDIQWIRADNAQCLDKTPNTTQEPTRQAQSTVRTPQNGSVGLNGYELGQCTGWVASHRYVPAGWGNASSWKQGAINAGWTVSNTPVVGAIAWRYGHVAYVIGVGSGTVTISEQNYDWHSGIRTIDVPTSSYIYLY